MFDPLKICHLMIPQSFKASIKKLFLEYLRPSFQASIWNPFGAFSHIPGIIWHTPIPTLQWIDYLITLLLSGCFCSGFGHQISKDKRSTVGPEKCLPNDTTWVMSQKSLSAIICHIFYNNEAFPGNEHIPPNGKFRKTSTSNMTWKGGKPMLVSGITIGCSLFLVCFNQVPDPIGPILLVLCNKVATPPTFNADASIIEADAIPGSRGAKGVETVCCACWNVT